MTLAVSLGLLALASLSSLFGMAALALSQERNWRNVCNGAKPSETEIGISRWCGSLLLMLALVFCVVRDGASFAALIWPLLLAAGAFVTAMSLAYKSDLLSPLAAAVSRANTLIRR